MKKVFLLVLIGFVLILNSVNAQDLVGYWTFDEGFGSTATDSSGYGNDGTLYGGLDSTGWTAGCHSGYCLEFDGQDDYVRINNFGDFSNGFTIIFWFKMSERVNMQRPISSIFFSTCYVSDLAPYSMPCYIGDGISFPSSQSTSGWSYDTWTHFTMTYDTATGDWIIYRNGNPVGTSSSSVVMDMTNYFCIGANCWATGSEGNFNGTIDEVKIYNRALTAEEINVSYSTGSLVKKTFPEEKTDTISYSKFEVMKNLSYDELKKTIGENYKISIKIDGETYGGQVNQSANAVCHETPSIIQYKNGTIKKIIPKLCIWK